ncbi:unnamed protein product [Vitrella brassicaformis CCMP3155]|uniref:Cupin type-1 domain-containing protein n=2 Tax=Vitrella brassicaformis TaxID=1169539 RepID=A0A0G4EJ88_VITBC|nr:unnamed protein product [Vitrella brassicaformis CCMP3155]|eukprot:CEL97078.1 unnamed protein product [Vitrella brassicaformis CCMP3155]
MQKQLLSLIWFVVVSFAVAGARGSSEAPFDNDAHRGLQQQFRTCQARSSICVNNAVCCSRNCVAGRCWEKGVYQDDGGECRYNNDCQSNRCVGREGTTFGTCRPAGTSTQPGDTDDVKEDDENGEPDVPLSRRAFRNQFDESSDFIFDFNTARAEADTNGQGGAVTGASVSQWPALSGHGLSHTLVDLAPCSINTPHVHPRATEIIYIIKGRVSVGFAEENGGRIVTNDVKEGDTAFFPHTLIHWQFNPTCEPAQFIATLNSDDGGVQTIAQAFFGLPDDVLATALGVDEYEVAVLREELPAGPALGLQREECRRKCGL